MSAVALCVGLALAIPIASVDAAEPEPFPGEPSRLPRIEIVTLSGRRVVLPDSGTGPGTLMTFAFRRQDQALIDSWLPWVEQIGTTGCEFYEVALLGPTVPRILRGAVLAGMRATVPRHLHAHLAPYYGDVDRYAESLGMHDRTTAHVMLVAHDGLVLMHAQGQADSATARLMLDACRALGSADSVR